MTRRHLAILALSAACLGLTGAVALAGTADVAETPAAACDALAAHPGDPAKPAEVEGIATGDIVLVPALDACRLAIEEDPNVPRYHYQLGRVFYDKGDFEQAYREFATAADAGYAAARGAQGYLLDEGLGTTADKTRAVVLYRQAAEADVAFAAHNLGVLLREGDGVPVDYAASLAFFRKAVALGYHQSLVDVGFAYDNGYGVAKDDTEAMRWYRQAAAYEIPEAFNNIGSLYENGEGVEKSTMQAIEWYKRAQAAGYALAFINMAHMLDSLPQDPDPKEAAVYIFQAMDAGSAEEDRFNLGYMFDEARWTSAFWTELQTRLAADHGFNGPVDGMPSPATRAALEALVAD